MALTAPRWNANLAALETALRSIPAGAHHGLDLGCGEGETTRRLRQHVAHATGLDRDLTSIAIAAHAMDDNTYVLGDVVHTPFRPGSFDVVTAVAVLHHVNLTTALEALADLVAPGGILLVVGLARSRTSVDKLRDVRDSIMFRIVRRRHNTWESPAPKVWPPPLSYTAARNLALRVLPDARFERVPYMRYTLSWQRPD